MDSDKGVAPLIVSFTNSSSNANSYAWNFGSVTETSIENDPSYTFKEPSIYNVQLIASADNMCHDTISYPVQTIAITIPNVFTPNDDGVNDFYELQDEGISNVTAVIFDRWGKKVGEINGINDGWDGVNIATGLPCNDGTYFVVLEVTDITDTISKYSTTLTLRR